MPLEPLPGFQHFQTHHCVTGSLRHIYAFHGYSISEEMLLGLGAGVGFIYWHGHGAKPFLGGRANVERPGEEGLEKTVGRRTGVLVESFHTTSTRRAEQALLSQLANGQPVMLVLDMGYLPYFDFGGQEYHFGGHVVVACGCNLTSREVLVADRDKDLHPVALGALALARGSRARPFPPRHAWYRFDFQGAHPPVEAAVRQAVRQCAQAMLQPPISNFGVKGIRKAAMQVRTWADLFDAEELRSTCSNAAIMIDARGGTGGGLFRRMYGHFLQEAAGLCGGEAFRQAGTSLLGIAGDWESVAGFLENASSAEDPEWTLVRISGLLCRIADEEESVWGRLWASTS